MENKFEWKKAGALALLGIIDRNKVLLGKWLWWYPLDFQSVWAPMIWSKYEQAENHQAAINVLHSSHRSPWIQVLPSFLSQNCLWDVAKYGFGLILGWLLPLWALGFHGFSIYLIWKKVEVFENLSGDPSSVWEFCFLWPIAPETIILFLVSLLSLSDVICNRFSLFSRATQIFFSFFFYQQIKVISLIKNRVVLLRK